MMYSTRTVSLTRLLIIQAFNDYTVTASEFSNESAISFPSRDRGGGHEKVCGNFHAEVTFAYKISCFQADQLTTEIFVELTSRALLS
jgi:hypothetical protein